MSSTQTDIQQPVGKNYPRLVADIGGTNARFALETAPQQIEKAQVLPCKDYDTIVDAAKAYLEQAGGAEGPPAALAPWLYNGHVTTLPHRAVAVLVLTGASTVARVLRRPHAPPQAGWGRALTVLRPGGAAAP